MATTRVLDRQVMAGARMALKVQHILRTRAGDIDVITQMVVTNVPTTAVKVTERLYSYYLFIWQPPLS